MLCRDPAAEFHARKKENTTLVRLTCNHLQMRLLLIAGCDPWRLRRVQSSEPTQYDNEVYPVERAKGEVAVELLLAMAKVVEHFY